MAETLWIFADPKTPRLTGLSIIARRLYNLFSEVCIEGDHRVELNELKNLISYYCSRKLLSPSEESSLPEADITLISCLCTNIVWCKQEVRHAAGSGLPPPPIGVRQEPPVETTQRGVQNMSECHMKQTSTFPTQKHIYRDLLLSHPSPIPLSVDLE